MAPDRSGAMIQGVTEQPVRTTSTLGERLRVRVLGPFPQCGEVLR